MKLEAIVKSVDWSKIEPRLALCIHGNLQQVANFETSFSSSGAEDFSAILEHLSTEIQFYGQEKDVECQALLLFSFAELLKLKNDYSEIEISSLFSQYCRFLRNSNPFYSKFGIDDRSSLRLNYQTLLDDILKFQNCKSAFVVLSGSYASNLMFPLSDLDGYVLVDSKVDERESSREVDIIRRVLSACGMRLNENILGYVNQYMHFDKMKENGKHNGIEIDFPRELWTEKTDLVCDAIFAGGLFYDRDYLTFNRFLQTYIQSILLGKPIDSPSLFDNEIWGFLFNYGGGSYSLYSKFVRKNNFQISKLFDSNNWTPWVWDEISKLSVLFSKLVENDNFLERASVRQKDLLLGANLFRLYSGSTEPETCENKNIQYQMKIKKIIFEVARNEIKNVKLKSLMKDAEFQKELKIIKRRVYSQNNDQYKDLYGDINIELKKLLEGQRPTFEKIKMNPLVTTSSRELFK